MDPAPIQTQQLSFSQNVNSVAVLGGVTQLVLHTNADVYIGFDTAANAQQSFLLLAANTADTAIELGGSVQKIYAMGKAGSGILYIIGIVD